MRNRARRVLMGICLGLGGGFLTVGPSTGCLSFLGNTAFGSADFSFIFDCDGALGGTLDLSTFLIDCADDGG